MMTQPSRHLRRALLSLAALVAMAGCRREEVTHFQVKKPVAAAEAPARPTMTGMQGAPVPDPPEPGTGNSIRWSLPKGWTQSAGSAMRYATLKPPAKGRVDVSVVVLAGEAGGELANVNRWRGQIGLPPLDAAALAKAREQVRSKAGPFSVYDFTGEGNQKTRLVAALASIEGNTWFLKMVGDEGPVGASRPEFLQLLRSVSRDTAN